MRGQPTAKKPGHQEPLKDWHKADIKAALEKRGWSLRGLAAHHDLSPSTLRDAFRWPYPAAEKRIAAAIGVHAMALWPSRYDEDGNPARRAPRPVKTTPTDRSTGLSPRRVKGSRAN